MDISRLAQLLKDSASDYSQLADAYPNLKNFAGALVGNVERNVPTQAELQNPEAMQQRALGYMSPMAGAIKAYHGSPHIFDKFDMSKIGTGEGAQAYGHGLYFAENPATAKKYSADRSYVGAAMQGNPKQINYDDPAWISQNTLDEFGNSQEAIDHLRMVLRTASKNYSKEGKEGLTKAIDMISSGEVKPKGNLYNVSIQWPNAVREAADPLGEHHLLDWDKPMNEQSDYVKNILSDAPEIQNLINKQLNWRKEAFDKYPETHPLKEILRGKLNNPYSPSGQKLYEEISKRKANTFGFSNGATSSVDSSEILKELGIPGIKYLDQGSRTGGGTSNYVMFGDEYPKIVNRASTLAELLRGK